MSWLDVPYSNEAEDIDSPGQPQAEMERSMRDVARTNRLFGGTATVLYHATRMLQDVPPGTAVRVLDIATGSADIPRALAAWGARRGLNLTIIGLDNHAAMLTMAGRGADAGDTQGSIHLVRADALRLPFAPRSFDLALCALASIDRLTTRGFVVSDLRRDRPTLWGVQASVAALGAHPFTRHDGPASVRRAWTPAEYRKMVGLSGVPGVRVRTHWYFRVALVKTKA